jgi:hypothetical protein
MTKDEISQIVGALMPAVERHLEEVLGGLITRLEALEVRKPESGKDGADGKDGKDGTGISGAIIDRKGSLILTLTDGSTRDLGCIVGKDGADGKDGSPGPAGEDGANGKDGADGESADPAQIAGLVTAEVERQLPAAVSKIKTVKGDKGDPGPAGKDGANGKDGRNGTDGVGFDDMEEELSDDGRLIIRRYKRGNQILKEFRFRVPAVIDRGLYQEGREYDPGDGVTWAGCYWICQKATNTKPGNGDAWRLAVKRGRDGKEGPQGPRGEPGKDARK